MSRIQGQSQSNGATRPSPLEVALEGKSEEFKRKVYQIARSSGVADDDPAFIFLVASGRLEVMLQEAPLNWQRLFLSFSEGLKQWQQQLEETLTATEAVALKRQETAIAQAAASAIKQAETKQARKSFWEHSLPAMLCLIATLTLGVSIGVATTRAMYRSEATTWGREIYELNEEQISKCQTQRRRSCPMFLPEGMMFGE